MALARGGRGLDGGQTLAGLLEEHRGVRNARRPPRLTEAKILRWADAWHKATGAWPMSTSGPIPGSGGETWLAVNLALHEGLRGLPGGDSLAELLRRQRGMENRQGQGTR